MYLKGRVVSYNIIETECLVILESPDAIHWQKKNKQRCKVRKSISQKDVV